MCAYGAPKNVYTLNKKQKRCACVKHLEVCGRRSRLSGNTCEIYKNAFHCIVGSATMFSSYWYGVCLWWWFGLSLIDLSSPPLLSLIPWKLQFGPLDCWRFNFNSYYFNSNFWSWLFCISFTCFQFHSSIPVYQILYFSIWSSFFEFIIFCLVLFVKVLLVFNFII